MKNKDNIEVFDPKTNTIFQEKIPSEKMLRFLYSDNSYTSELFRHLVAKLPLPSVIFGWLAKTSWTKRFIQPFINGQRIKIEDFEEKKYKSFNDFFMRRIQPTKRPLAKDAVIAPCDGRYLFYQDLSEKNSFYIKGQRLSLKDLLKDDNLANIYSKGSMIISRLAPVDYHGFHFPADVKLNSTKLINGPLFSVNPIALREMVHVLTENKRMLIDMTSSIYGNILQVVIGATTVGSIIINKEIGKEYKKGEELGFFSFGGSMVITLFQNTAITFDKTFTSHTKENQEVLLTMGSSIVHHE